MLGLLAVLVAPAATGSACTTAADCDDGNACTTDSCSANGVCEHAAPRRMHPLRYGRGL